MLSRTPPSMLDSEEKPYKYRLESISQAMSWIKEELETMKEGDKSLTEIFRKLQADIQELGDICNDARHSFRTSRCVSSSVNHDLELSFEDSEEQTSDLPTFPMVATPTFPAAVPPAAVPTKALPIPQHQLSTSVSANDSLSSGSPQPKLNSSPSNSGNSCSGLEIADISSMSRYSSVDSGIQFPTEPEVVPNNADSSLFDEIFSKLGWQQNTAN